MRITNEMLVKANVCEDQRAIFAAEWPEGCEVTIETAQRAVALKLDLDWAARHLLPERSFAAYCAATAPAWATFDAAMERAFAAYCAATAPAWPAYDAATAAAWAAFDAARATAWAVFEAATATAYVEACGIADRQRGATESKQ